MKIKDLYNGRIHEYGSNSHDSLVISDDGRTLTYYNLQNGDGSNYGDYRFVPYMEADVNYWNIGGVKTKRKTGRWLHIRCNMYECPECSRTYTALTPDDSCDADFCPYCGIKLEGTE